MLALAQDHLRHCCGASFLQHLAEEVIGFAPHVLGLHVVGGLEVEGALDPG